MAKYEVVKEFLDRYDFNKHLHPGDIHKPHSEDRAEQLVELGFIKAVADKPEVKKGKGKPVTPAESTEPVTEVKEDKVSDPDESSEAK